MANSCIFLNDINIKSYKLGDDDIKLYLGDKKLYPLEKPIGDVVAKFSVDSTSSPTHIIGANWDEGGYSSALTAIEIDGVAQQSLVSAYTFSTTGEHTVKYTLADTTTLGSYAFCSCYNLTSVTIPNSVTSIGDDAFYDCDNLTSIVIPNGVTSIGYDAFAGCSSLTSIDIPSGVTSIGEYVFYSCSSLTSIDIPSGVTSIGEYVFYNCTSLTSVTVNATTPPTLGTNAFLYTNDCPIYVPSGSVSTYQSASVWSNYASRIQAIP